MAIQQNPTTPPERPALPPVSVAKDAASSPLESVLVSNLRVPKRLRGLTYLIGMVGFPVIIASYIVVVLSGDLKQVDRSLTMLSSRIDERPMSLDRTTDFVIYVTDNLESELRLGTSVVVGKLPAKCSQVFDVPCARVFARRVRPVWRTSVLKHRRFAERFPSAAGNIGSLFRIPGPAEDVEAGELDGDLAAKMHKDFLLTLMTLTESNLKDLLTEEERETESSGMRDSLQAHLLEVTEDAITSAVAALRREILRQARAQASDLGQDMVHGELFGKSKRP